MSEDPFTCRKHFWHLDGVCASCLKEKLNIFASSAETTSHGIKLDVRSMRLQLNACLDESREEKESLSVSEDDLFHLECSEKNASFKRTEKSCSGRDKISENSDDTFKENLNHLFSSSSTVHLEDPNLINRVHYSQTACRETKAADNAHSRTSCICNVCFGRGFTKPEDSSIATFSRSVEGDATYRSACCHTFDEVSGQDLDERNPSRTVLNVGSENSRDWNSELRQSKSSEHRLNQCTSPKRKRHLSIIKWTKMLATFLNLFKYIPTSKAKSESKDQQSFSEKPGTSRSPSIRAEADLKHGSEAPGCTAFYRDCGTASLKKSSVRRTACKDSERGSRETFRSRHFVNAGGYWNFSLSPWRHRLTDTKPKF